jgi:hypothetical protein
MNASFTIRKECPPGACVCDRELLLGNPAADLRVLRLTKDEEKRLLARLEDLTCLEDLRRMERKLFEQLGIVLHIAPSARGVRTMRGFNIQLEAQPGLCRQTRENVPAAIRRCLEKHPEIAYALLDEQGLLGAALMPDIPADDSVG